MPDKEREGIFCSQCKDYCWSSAEQDCKLCNRCADAMYEREQARREWDYYHGD